MSLCVTIYRLPVTAPCAHCGGMGCRSCRGTGEGTVCETHWECGACGAQGEDGDDLQQCPTCACDTVRVVDDCPRDDGPDLPDDDPEPWPE